MQPPPCQGSPGMAERAAADAIAQPHPSPTSSQLAPALAQDPDAFLPSGLPSKEIQRTRIQFHSFFQGAKHLVFLCTGTKAKHFHHISRNITGLKALVLEEKG